MTLMLMTGGVAGYSTKVEYFNVFLIIYVISVKHPDNVLFYGFFYFFQDLNC